MPTESNANEYVVTILTPQSGNYVTMGKSMRNGIALALEQAEDQGRFREGVRLSLKDFDDNETTTKLARQTQQQVLDNDAILVIGPMLSTRAESVAATANRYAFPLLSPAVSEGINAMGPWSFRTGASPYRLIQAMTRSILTSTRGRKIAVVSASGNAGFESQARTVASVVNQLGRLMTAEIALVDSEDGYAETSASLLSVNPDLIFIMMDAEPGGVLAARLRKDGLPASARLVFGPAAASPALLQVGREYVEGALVATDYLPEIPGEQNQKFVAMYQQRYGLAPDRWAGLGYTTGLIAAEAIRASGPAPTRTLVRDALDRIGKVTVPLGKQTWTMGSQHEPLYDPALFTIRDGQYTPFLPQ